MATICMARSPATAIAIVKELRCKGKMTTTFLGITVASDIFVLIGRFQLLCSLVVKSSIPLSQFDKDIKVTESLVTFL